MILALFFLPGVHEAASPVVGQEVAPLPHSSGSGRGDWLAMTEQSLTLSHVFSMQVLHLEPRSRSTCFCCCCCQLRKSVATSFFKPAQVRPDFPVQITIALFTFHTLKGQTPGLCWSRCLRRKLKD